MWCVQAQVIRTKDGWTHSAGIPTFYLMESVQGITTIDKARLVAERLIRACMPPGDSAEIALSVLRVCDEPT